MEEDSFVPAAAVKIAISGGGIGGLTLALALKKNLGITATVYEQAPQFGDGVGGAIGMYPNGLRVMGDISPSLLNALQTAGRPYMYRRWQRHDGSDVAVASERFLFPPTSRLHANPWIRWLFPWFKARDDHEVTSLRSIGIRRWKVQRALVDACIEAEIPLIMGTRVNTMLVAKDPKNEAVHLELSNGQSKTYDLVFGCDGVKSVMRTSLFGATSDPAYTGMVCLMGVASFKHAKDGICFPSSSTTHCHACFYSTGEDEQIFQMYFPEEEKPETWKVLAPEDAKEECVKLSTRLKADGWHPSFVEPILKSHNVLRVGLRSRDPIPTWYHLATGRVILVGDAAHPPVPYIGQGAMMAIEDVGVLVRLIRRLACRSSGSSLYLSFERVHRHVLPAYQALRIPRTTKMLASSNALGRMQLERAAASAGQAQVKSKSVIVRMREIWAILVKELGIKLQVFWYGTLPVMWFGSGYEYSVEVDKWIEANAKDLLLE
ncbi:hypothetical protein BJ742DRAFT_775377 [Cladochytrium replicatum]|nr:hypothetical protein BJ742DRAFT_775377 [Cladochytrium replicatum]